MFSSLTALLLLLAAPVLILLSGKLAKPVALLITVFSGVCFLGGAGPVVELSFAGFDLVPLRLDGLNTLLIQIFHLSAILTIIYSWQVSDRKDTAIAAFYFAAAIGLCCAADLFSFFVWWEMLTIGATLMIATGNDKNGLDTSAQRLADRIRSAQSYFLFHIVGGLILLSAIVMIYLKTGDLSIRQIGLSGVEDYLFMLGLGINAGFPFVHSWITDSYPRASVAATVWMSAITTKTAAYALIRFFPGEQILIWIGVVMMVFPVFYAVVENNLRRVLSYSMINQVGLIVTAIGIGTGLSLAGATAHIVTDIFFKGLFFMAIGAVIYRTGYQNATDLGGLYKYMPLTCFFCIIAAFAISAFPLFSGFISKSMVVTAAAESHMLIVWLFLLFASAAVLEHAGIKVPFFAFFAHDSGLKPKEAPLSMLIAMAGGAVVCVTLGVFPDLLYAHLPFEFDYEPYTAAHVVTQMQLLIAAAIAFILMLLAGIYPPEKRGRNLDVDFLYDLGCKKAGAAFARITQSTNDKTNQLVHVRLGNSLVEFIQKFPGNVLSLFTKNAKPYHEAVMDGTVPVAWSIFFALIIFLLFAF